MRTASGIIIGIILAFGAVIAIHYALQDPDPGPRTVSVTYESVYHTPSGRLCADDDVARQLLHGVQAGEEPCVRDAKLHKTEVALPRKTTEELRVEYMCGMLRRKKLADLTVDEWHTVQLCETAGAGR